MSETKAHYLNRLIDTGNLASGLTEKRGRVLNSFVRLSIIDVTTHGHDPDWIERKATITELTQRDCPAMMMNKL